MVANVDISETAEGRILARLASIAMSRVEDLHARALAAEATAEAVSLHAACSKAERSARQTLALKLKFVCDNARAVREEERQAREFTVHRDRTRKEAVARRREDLRVRLERIAWDEVPDEDWQDDFLGSLNELLDEETQLSTFTEEDPDAQFERFKRRLDLDRTDEADADETAEPEPADPPQDADLSAEARSAEAENDDEPEAEADDPGPFVRLPRKPKPDSS